MKQRTVEYLKQIPFMELDFSFDFNKLKEEILNANNSWYEYNAPFLNPENLKKLGIPDIAAHIAWRKTMYAGYNHCTLITYNPAKDPSDVSETFAWKSEGTDINYYDSPVENRRWYYTPEADRFPYLMGIIKQFTNKPVLCKLIKSTPHNWLGWHSHQNDPVIKEFNKPEQCIFHIPIIQHSDVSFIVKKHMPTHRGHFKSLEEYKSDADTFVGSFTPGKMHFFNGFYPHAFKNYSKEDRLDVIIYSDTEDNELLEDLMDRSIQKYSGIFVEPPNV